MVGKQTRRLARGPRAAMKSSAQAPAPAQPLPARIFPALFGFLLGLSLLKFGNPAIMERWVTPPANIYEFVLGYPWPMSWGWWLLAAVAAVGLFTAHWKPPVPRWLLALPALWLVWQCVAATQTVNVELTLATIKHFTACVLCFYVGCFCLAPLQKLAGFWLGLLCGFLLVLIVGWQQHFGGLAETRRYFFLYLYPQLKEIPPGYLKKMSSNRIFSTLFYPNALAGALLLFLPITLGAIELARDYMTKPAKWFLVSLIGVGALACLYWSGSKAGWLLMLVSGLLVLLRLPLSKQIKFGVAGLVLVAGLAGFFWRYSTFFEKGATSVTARFDYWQAALRTTQAHPLVGTGPGTFSIPYLAMKRPDSEPSKLVHNDYLEQASDSGIIGFLSYTIFIAAALALSFKRHIFLVPSDARGQNPTPHQWLRFAVWLGLLAWSLQGLVEFGLYIPGLAWPAFSLLGWLLGQQRA
jgi:O-antigen ligase